MYDSDFCLSTRLKVYGGAEQKKSQVGGGGSNVPNIRPLLFLFIPSFFRLFRYIPCAR